MQRIAKKPRAALTGPVGRFRLSQAAAYRLGRTNGPMGAASSPSAPVLRRAWACGSGFPQRTGQLGAIDRSAAGETVAPPIVHDVLRSSGHPIDPDTRGPFERQFGHDFSSVRVHTGERAAASAAAISALAYAVGNHIVLGAGHRVAREGEDGQLLAHELVHVTQWGNQPIPSRLPIGPADGAAERQARTGQAGHPRQTAALQRAVPVCMEYRAGDTGTANPSPGVRVNVSRPGRRATVNARVQTHGAESNVARAQTVQNTISRLWNGNFPDGYRIATNVNVTHRPPGRAENSSALQVEIARDTILGTHFNALTRDIQVDLAIGPNPLGWSVAHEFGHAMSLRDRYSESIVSRLGALFGRQRAAEAHAGYENNIMGVHGGRLESRNVQDLIGLHIPYTCTRWRLESPL